MYELDDYFQMIEDPVRTPAYLAAMRAVIRPGDRVLELGTGFGYFAVQACLAGAAHVWAVEPNDAVAHGRALAAANGCADRITFVQGRAEQLVLDARADVLVEDLRGVSPLHGARLAVLRDARARLLAPGARCIPARDELILAPAELPPDLARLAPDAPERIHGIAVAPVRSLLAQAIHRTRADASSLLADGVVWATLDYAAPPTDDPAGAAAWVITRDGVLAGLVSWFATTLAPGIGFDTGPTTARTVYDRGFLPLGAPLAVRAGDRVSATVRTRFDGSEYVWVWDVVVEGASGTRTRRGSNLATRAISAARRARRAAAHVPARTAAVAQLQTLAGAVDGVRTLDAIAQLLREAHGAQFADDQAALRWAGDQLARLDEEPHA